MSLCSVMVVLIMRRHDNVFTETVNSVHFSLVIHMSVQNIIDLPIHVITLNLDLVHSQQG